MNHEFDDLKQFVAATVSQAEERLRNDIAAARADTQALRDETRDGFAGVAESIETLNEHLSERDETVDHQVAWLQGAIKAHDQTLSLHSKRLGHLEDRRPTSRR